jgi:ParB/RepB/Spo0J family partition protein
MTTNQPKPKTDLIDLSLIKPNPHQPRTIFDQTKLNELAASIKTHGVIQPVIIEPNNGTEGYFLHAGERRCRAALIAGLSQIPAYIVPPGTDPKQLLIRATIENTQRENLPPLDEARAYQEMHDTFDMTDAQIATENGKSRSYITNTRRLLQLHQKHQTSLNTGHLSPRQALALLPFYQLPEGLQEKVLNHWGAKKITSKPDTYTSDEIRIGYKTALRGETKLIKWPIDHHSPCFGCGDIYKIDKENNCANEKCFVKTDTWHKTNQMRQATTATNLPPLDPDYNPKNVSLFWSGDEAQLQTALCLLALDKPCPNLCLKQGIGWTDEQLSPPDYKQHKILYVCHHPDKPGCHCKNEGENTAEIRAEKNRKAAISTLQNKTAHNLALEFEGYSQELLGLVGQAICGDGTKFETAYNNDDWEKMAKMITTKLVNQKTGYWMDLKTNRQILIDWLTPLNLAYLVPDTQQKQEPK